MTVRIYDIFSKNKLLLVGSAENSSSEHNLNMKKIVLSNEKTKLFEKIAGWLAENKIKDHCVLFNGHYQDNGTERIIVYHKNNKGYKLSWINDKKDRYVIDEFMSLEYMFEMMKVFIDENTTELYCRRFLDSFRVTN